MTNNKGELERNFNEADRLRNSGNFTEAINIFLNILKDNKNF